MTYGRIKSPWSNKSADVANRPHTDNTPGAPWGHTVHTGNCTNTRSKYRKDDSDSSPNSDSDWDDGSSNHEKPGNKCSSLNVNNIENVLK